MFGKRESSIFGNIAFSEEEQQRTDAYLRQKLNSNFLSRRPGPGGRRLTYLESCKAIEIANEAFGFNGWSCRIVDCNVECKEKDDNGRWSVIYSAVVRIELKDGACHEDVGFGQSDGLKDLGAALEQAKKASISDARKRALRLFGEYLGNSCYDKEHIKDVAANRASHAALQSPTSIKLEVAQSNGTTTPPLHPPQSLGVAHTGSAPGFQPPPKTTHNPPVTSPGGIAAHRPPPPVSNPSPPHGNPKPAPAPAPPKPKTGPLRLHEPLESKSAKPDARPHHGFSPVPIKTEPSPAPLRPTMQQPSVHGGPVALPRPAPTSSLQPQSHGATSAYRPPSSNAPTFVRPMPTNVSPSMQFQQEGDQTRKRCLDMYGSAAMDEMEGLRLSQFDFDDPNSKKKPREHE
ncbi:hypothetical protein LEN26_007340 [Aphanomyces euteiches]|nr:hypothetical protein LEN26_007340 [Aphanomyces euteiches]KAH9192160.1 hypothetical protein AeNC1_005867 [Aphanomyces euteiches]